MLNRGVHQLGVAAAGLFAASVLAAQPAQTADIQYLGQSTLKITTKHDDTIVIDPFLTKNPVTPEAEKKLSAHGDTDLILLTHGHFDNVADAPKLAERTGADVAVNYDLGNTLRTLGMIPGDQIVGFNKGGSIQPLEGVAVTMTNAEHSSSIVRKDPETGEERTYPGGQEAGFVVDLPDGTTIYHAGDTAAFASMAWIAERHEPDVAFLPIGDRFTMGPEGAAAAATELLETDSVVPIHYGTFDMLTGTPEAFRNALDDRGYDGELVVMEPGETKDF
jgi:L-ascorbate metabolism protein UlaG (beta-lactamase superfamily)